MRHNILYSFLITAVILLSGCTRSEMVDTRPDGSVTLSISMPAPVTKDMTRSVPAGFNTISDLNLIITGPATSGGNPNHDDAVVRYSFWLNDLSQSGIDAVIPKKEWVTYSGSDGDFGIHFDEEWFTYFALKSTECAFFVVANHNRKIEVSTVGELRETRAQNQFVMFGKTCIGDSTGNHGHENGRSYEIELTRLVAMVTVEIDGSELGQYVQVTPRRISLHNVPEWCRLDGNNIITEADGITPKSGAIMPMGLSVPVSWGSISQGSQPVGGHYDVADGTATDNDDPAWGNNEVQPLYLYENYHGDLDGFGASDVNASNQWLKRPSGIGTSPAEIEAASGACSYLQVDADYYDGSQYGTVNYRVFLGADQFTKFDVMRNTYYRFKLKLRNSAISEKDISWRVDAGLGDIQVNNSDYLLGGSGALLNVDLSTTKKQWRCGVFNATHWDNTNKWAYMSGETHTAWVPLDANQTSGNFFSDVIGTTSRIWIYVAPMIRGEGTWPANAVGTKRELTFRCWEHPNGVSTPDVVITQYEPVSTEINGTTVYVDRVDIGDMPWGFETIQLNENQASGFENGYHLMMEAPDAGEGDHRAAATAYLPFGNGGLNGGFGASSAMMHAAFMHNYHRAVNAIGLDTGNFLTDPARPVAGSYAYAIPSRAEWRLLEQLNVFDPEFPVGSWDRYWTSDADTEPGSRKSYVYQKGYGDQTAERTEVLKYRMIYTPAPAPAVLAE